MARLHCFLFSIAFILTPFYASLVAASCYCVKDGQTFDCTGGEVPCGNASSVDTGAQLCCVAGDVCGKDSLCHFQRNIPNTSGYYLGGCTDPLYQDPVCQQHCVDAGTADVVYNASSNLWACCGYPDNTVSCQNPRQDKVFQAIRPEQFPGTAVATTTGTASTSSSSMTSISVTSSGTAAPQISASSTDSASGGLSTGAIAGIAVAAVIVGLALLAGLIYFFLRRRKRNLDPANGVSEAPYFNEVDTQKNTMSPGHPASSSGYKGQYASVPYTPGTAGSNEATQGMHEVDSNYAPAQLYGSETPHPQELAS